MKFVHGASVVFYLLLSLSLFVLLILLPYPYYSAEMNKWYFGLSIGSRAAGNKDPGIPMEKVVKTVIVGSVSSPFVIDCTTQQDCKNYVVKNQCRVYCGNSITENQSVVDKLNKNRGTCDSGVWRAPRLNCYCVQSKCVNFED